MGHFLLLITITRVTLNVFGSLKSLTVMVFKSHFIMLKLRKFYRFDFYYFIIYTYTYALLVTVLIVTAHNITDLQSSYIGVLMIITEIKA